MASVTTAEILAFERTTIAIDAATFVRARRAHARARANSLRPQPERSLTQKRQAKDECKQSFGGGGHEVRVTFEGSLLLGLGRPRGEAERPNY